METINFFLELLRPYFFIVLIPFCALGVVYIIGRYLGLVKDYRIKNGIAILVIFGAMFFYDFNMEGLKLEWNNIAIWLAHSLISIIFYALVCFRLFDRIDFLLDKKLGEDKSFYEETKKPSPKKRRPKKS